MGKKVLSADNQQERPKTIIEPWYIVGFTEGEGTFHIALYVDPRMKQRIKIIPEFHINQSYLRISTLEEIKKYFDCGYIKRNHGKNDYDTTYVYVVRDRSDLLNRIIPFFRKYPLRSVKQESFRKFAYVVEMIQDGKHLQKLGVKKIVNLAYTMNVNGKYRFRKKADLLRELESSETIR